MPAGWTFDEALARLLDVEGHRRHQALAELGPPPPQRYSWCLPGGALAPAAARCHVTRVMRDVDRADVETALLLTSELVTGVLANGGGIAAGRLHVTLTDRHVDVGVEATASMDLSRCVGMVLVSALASAWGTTDEADHTCTRAWFRLRY